MMRWNPFTFFDRIGAPYRIRSWGDPVTATNINFNQCIEIEKDLRQRCKIAADIPIWNRQKIKRLTEKIKWRRWKFGIYDFLFKILPVLSLITFLPFLTNGYTYALYCSMILLPFSPIFWLLRNRTSRNKETKTFEFYFSDDLSEEDKSKLSTEIWKLQTQSTQLFWVGNHNELFEILLYALTAENWFLLFTGIEADRKGIWLKDSVPTGIIVSPKKDKKKTRNMRDFEIQRARMSTASKVKILYCEIKAIIANGPKLNKEKNARLDAILFVSENPAFWNAIRKNKKSIDAEKFSSHKTQLNNIFRPISRPKNTLSETAITNLMLDFVELKDRALENWFREIGINRFG